MPSKHLREQTSVSVYSNPAAMEKLAHGLEGRRRYRRHLH
jgi:hypothetical protein